MLILSRKLNESIVIDNDVVIRVMSLSGRRVRIGIEAPAERLVLRKEVWDRLQPEDDRATGRARTSTEPAESRS